MIVKWYKCCAWLVYTYDIVECVYEWHYAMAICIDMFLVHILILLHILYEPKACHANFSCMLVSFAIGISMKSHPPPLTISWYKFIKGYGESLWCMKQGICHDFDHEIML